MFVRVSFASITTEDRRWACYLHACLSYVEGRQINNSTLRRRFDLDEKSSATISRMIKDCVEAGLIKPFDAETAPRYMKYIPYWA